MPEEPTSDAEKKASSVQVEKVATRRKIPGNLPYLTTAGSLKTILNKIIELAKPDKFNYDFLNNVVKMSGGGARSCIPILKKMGFLQSDNSTTELYNKFRTDSGRSAAAYQGLRNAFPEIFKRSDYAYSLEDSKIRDIILEITGLKSTDSIANAIKATFNVIRSFVNDDFDHNQLNTISAEGLISKQDITLNPNVPTDGYPEQERPLGIAYNINIILPETSDLNVLNAIFRSVKENLLR